MVDVRATARALRDLARRRIGPLLQVLLPGPHIRPELEHRVRRVFDELKDLRAFEPSHDLARAVVEHLRERQDESGSDDS